MFNKVEIIYGSTTGNTESVAKYVKSIIAKQKIKVDCKDSSDFLDKNVDLQDGILYILASSSWGVEPCALQEDFEIFYSNINKESMALKNFALLGCGDKYYPHFCGALDVLSKDILNHKGKLFTEILRIQDDWEDRKKEITKWATNLAKLIKESK